MEGIGWVKMKNKGKKVCDYCEKAVPSADIYLVMEVGKGDIKNVCKDCISFVKSPKKEE